MLWYGVLSPRLMEAWIQIKIRKKDSCVKLKPQHNI